MAKSKANDTMSKAMDLSRDTAKATLETGVKTAELTENYMQGVYKAGYDANYDALKVAKNYWDATTEIRQDWLKLFTKTGENLIDATANIEMPTVGDVTEFGKGVYNSVEKTVGNLTAQAKAATK
ncbi:MAG: hypothetical protein HKN25_04630 [Pyrinomonadaceae bacterium]|nr:hypothetical protein [Pyrinomonadaceae bacterium]